MGQSDGSSALSRRNLVKWRHNGLAGIGVLQLCAPTRHAHGFEPTEYVGTTFIGDEISDLHVPQVRTGAASDIGTQLTGRYPLVGAFFETPLRHVADADDADGPLSRNHGNVAEAALDHRLTRILHRRVSGHRHWIGRHPFTHTRLAGMHSPGDRAHQVALREDADHPSEIGDDDSTHPGARHLLGRLADGVGGFHSYDVLGHHVSQRRHAGEHRPEERTRQIAGAEMAGAARAGFAGARSLASSEKPNRKKSSWLEAPDFFRQWAIVDSNHGPPPYQSGALTN